MCSSDLVNAKLHPDRSKRRKKRDVKRAEQSAARKRRSTGITIEEPVAMARQSTSCLARRPSAAPAPAGSDGEDTLDAGYRSEGQVSDHVLGPYQATLDCALSHKWIPNFYLIS